ncbi:hypothetical protein [Clostridium sp. D5]|uniref:hypothetical protein n=1 Tax=Clostridium sp. D5 TaxID=556261 RepID=UPI000555DBAE|nr:hypothetical protein [Clostridium sp. D5]
MEMKNDAFITELKKEFRENCPEVCEKHMEKTAGLVKTFYESRQNSRSRTRRIGFGELVLRQIRFIGWKIWCLQLAVMAVMYCALHTIFWNMDVASRHMPFLLFAMAVMLAWMAVPMMGRSIRYRMAEIESASRFSLGRLMAARLLITEAGAVVLMAGMMRLTAAGSIYRLSEIVFSSLLPFLAVTGICTGLLGHIRVQSYVKSCNAAVACILASVFIMDRLGTRSPADLPAAAGWTACVFCLAACAYQIRRLWKKDSFEDGTVFC